jgi:hypothetical protein
VCGSQRPPLHFPLLYFISTEKVVDIIIDQ